MDSKAKFGDIIQTNRELSSAARVAVKEVLDVKKGERVLIVTNPEMNVSNISMAVYDAVIDAKGVPVLCVQPYKTQLDFAEPSVVKAIESNPDIAISLSAEKLGKDGAAMANPHKAGDKTYDNTFSYLMAVKKMRSFWSPSVTMEMFAKTVPIDYRALRHDCKNLKESLDKAISARITTKAGTDITIGLNGRLTHVDDGDFRRPGTGGNLPAGEVYISPELGKSKGTIVFDGSISVTNGDVVTKEPVVVTVEGGFVTTIEGGREADALREAIENGEKSPGVWASEGKIASNLVAEYKRNARNLGELGIGLNRAAEIIGNMLEDEKVYSTCHIAIGSNYDDDANAMTHLDCLVKKPTIELAYSNGAKKTVMEAGALVSR
ncbi:MAG: aminopeptidase [Methanobacteriota archaeon]